MLDGLATAGSDSAQVRALGEDMAADNEIRYRYLSEALGEERRPFDREYVLAHDPGLVRFRDYAPLPWEVTDEP
jgi:hypothetical protein